MKKLFNSIRSKVNNLTTRAIVAVSNAKAEGYVDSGVKILIAVVIGALLLSLLYGLFKTTIMRTVTNKMTDIFIFRGNEMRPWVSADAQGYPANLKMEDN